ncbi:MAG TPA: cbb3-type cytochrome c oxidase subunit I [Alphaproteobacteria bacterium]|jgi:cytochrome c oxidase subunit 1
MEHLEISAALARAPARDKALLKSLFAAALATLAAGVVAGALVALTRGGATAPAPENGYRLLTSHGVSAFFFWLYFAQAALLLALVMAHGRARPALALRAFAWLGGALMLAGFAATQAGTWLGAPLLYDGEPDLAQDDRDHALLFYAGYLGLALGLACIALSAIATAIAGKAERGGAPWSAVTFGAVAWAGLILVSGVAMLNTFLPAVLWAAGAGAPPTDHSTGWHILFHNLHYLPLMGTVLVWYALARDYVGAGSLFGERFSKLVFALYLIFVPPTSLYHMFLEPGLAPLVRALGSVLSLFVGVPTIAAFLVIVISLEARARAAGRRGAFGWARALPWGQPAADALAIAVLSLALGGTFSFVLIQEKLAGLLSDTFFVPAYFHFLTVGTVSLTLLAGIAHAMPGLGGHAPPLRRLLRALPYAIGAALLVFALAGVVGGLTGLPRRALDVSYDGQAPALWRTISIVVGAAGAVMATAVLAYALILLGGLARLGARAAAPPARAIAPPPERAVVRYSAWSAPASVAVLILAIYAATALAFELMHALPVLASGSGH